MAELPESDNYGTVDGELSDGELREISKSLNDYQDTYEKVVFLETPKMPCLECGGKGSAYGGVLGDYCAGCDNTGYVTQPGVEVPDGPDFIGMRAQLSAYGDALADRALPAHATCHACQRGKDANGDICSQCNGTLRVPHPGKRGLALPPAQAIRDIGAQAAAAMDDIRERMERARLSEGKKTLQIEGVSPERRSPKSDIPSDDELDALEAEVIDDE